MKVHILSIKYFNLFILIFAVLIENESISQTKYFGGFGYLSTGYQNIDIKNLNAQLKIHNFPELDKKFVAMGGGGFGIMNNFVLGGEGFGLIGSEKSNQDYNISLFGGYGLFDLGYVLYSENGLTIFPLIGFGGGGIDITINEKKLVNFDDVLSNPKRGSNLSVGGLILNIGMNAIYNIDLFDNERNSRGFTIGVNFGYTHFLQLGNWTLFENEISNGPEVSISGFYLKFTIGGGGIRKKESFN